MYELVIFCAEDEQVGEAVLEKLALLKDAEIFKRYTTLNGAGTSFNVVSSRTFFDMVEECKFLEYHDADGVYYGTPHVREDKLKKDRFMLNTVEVALEIKKYSTKAITIYLLPEESLEEFKTTEFKWYMPKTKAKLLDFMVVYSSVEEAVQKVQKITEFMREHGMHF